MIKRDSQGRVLAVDLDIKNPHANDLIDYRQPAEIIQSAIAKEREVLSVLEWVGEFQRPADWRKNHGN